jgi:predicted TPR repeat methyltransferase
VNAEPYTALAGVYDQVLKHVDYDRWYRYLRSLMLRYMERPRLVLELGCGTGRFGAYFSRDQFPIYGMDRSLEMLKVAKKRAFADFHIFCGDMTGFSLKGKFDFIFSVHDTMNYLLTESDLRRVFSSAVNCLDEQGIFMFDLTTEHNIRRFFEGKTTRYRFGGTAVEWNNTYDARRRIVASTMSFRRNDGPEVSERHLQRIYRIEEVKRLLRKENLRLVDLFGDYTFDPPHEETIMINFVTRRA